MTILKGLREWLQR